MKWFLFLFFLLFTTHFLYSKDQPTLEYDPSGVNPPEFSGGLKAYNKFLSKNLKWPTNGMDDTEGRVIVSFIVEKDGRLTNFKVEKSLEKEFDAEALRVLRKSPRWIPAKKNGKAVRIKYSLPINFTMSQ